MAFFAQASVDNITSLSYLSHLLRTLCVMSLELLSFDVIVLVPLVFFASSSLQLTVHVSPLVEVSVAVDGPMTPLQEGEGHVFVGCTFLGHACSPPPTHQPPTLLCS